MQINLTNVVGPMESANDIVSKMINNLEKGKLSDILRFYSSFKDQYEQIDEVRKKLFIQVEHLSRNVIPDRMAEEGVTNMTVDGQRYVVNSRQSASITDKEAGYEWLRDNGHGDIIQTTVNSSTLSSFARKYLEDTGRDLPEFFKISQMKFTSVTKT